MRDTPTGPVVAALAAGAKVTRQETRAGHTRVLIEGFVEGAQLGGKKGKYPAHVSASGGAALHASADGSDENFATLTSGTGVAIIARSGKWVKVRRGGWLGAAAFTAAPAAKTPAPATVAKSAAPAPSATTPAPKGTSNASSPAPAATALVAAPAAAAAPLPDGALVTTRPSELRTAPDGGATMGTAAKDAMLTPLARERGWVRVRMEGWVREADLSPADTAARSAVSAADLRADPNGSRGKVVRWEVEIISFQLADPLRKDLTPDEPYLLARGPGRENALLYLAVPPSLVADAKAMPALATAIITARVRTGRSEPTGVPVLDLQQLSRK
ncbi:MAG: hypothetical protein HY275_03480 [Gemmatimonadetes bacterium]|nr:hypothetical protein [Gemmatimonadota bacterium]